jgi:hypothetical protein
MEVSEEEAKKLAKYIVGVKKSADKFTDYIQATAAVFDMEMDEMCLALGNLIEATVSNLLRGGSEESVVTTLEYIDAMILALEQHKDGIMKEHIKNQKG